MNSTVPFAMLLAALAVAPPCWAHDQSPALDSTASQIERLADDSRTRLNAIRAGTQEPVDCVNSPFLTLPFSRDGDNRASMLVRYDVDSHCPDRQFITVGTDEEKALFIKDLKNRAVEKLAKALDISESIARIVVDGYSPDNQTTVVETLEEAIAARRKFAASDSNRYQPSFDDWARELITDVVKKKIVLTLFMPLEAKSRRVPAPRPALRVPPLRPTAAGDKA